MEPIIKHGRCLSAALVVILCLTLAGCSSTRHVPPGQLLLDHTRIEVIDSDIPASELNNYLRQKPNARTLGIAPLRLHTYSLSGRDSTKWYNRWIRRIGEPPVIFSPHLTSASQRQLTLALINRGYMAANVVVDTLHRANNRKIDVIYKVYAGLPHTIRSYTKNIADTTIANILAADTIESLIIPGVNLDRTLLDSERTRIVNRLQSSGYYAFAKNNISFTADTIRGNRKVDLTMNIAGDHHNVYQIRRVIFQPDFRTDISPAEAKLQDTIPFRDIYIITTPTGSSNYIKPKQLWEFNSITPGEPYNASQFNRTFEALGRMGIIRSVSTELIPVGEGKMDAVIRLSRNSIQGVSAELEGTNSEGDLGAGIGLTYQHRNLFHGSEQLTVKARGSYESLSGNLEGLINNHYTEASLDIALTLPKFSAPFLSRNYKRKMLASTEFSLNGNYQERPEYTRVIAGAGWRYKWNNRRNTNRRIFDLIDVSYVFLPRSTINFLDEVAGGNPLLRYSYEDHFIMRMGYSVFLTNKVSNDLLGSNTNKITHNKIWTFRAKAEVAGNLLYAISNIIHQHKSDGAYKIFGTQYSQYAKAEADYMIAKHFSRRTSLAFRIGAGVAVPYGNSSMVPFEKRFYAGGANSVRGWGVRTLGPGRYDARNTVTNFINQCGDIRLDMNLECRVKLFWVLEGAAFIDAGNIWTIRNYENQPGGLFKFNSFYKELAWAYGIGLRLDFTYFLIRFDLGMKAYNPAMNQESWPLLHPNWHRDATFHFSVGYPF